MSFPGMSRWANKLALVTGASAGIGAEICKALTQHGVNVIGCARNIKPIQEMAESCKKSGFRGFLAAYQCDLKNGDEIERMFQWIKTNYQGGIHILVNSAGLSKSSTLVDSPYEELKEMLDVNVLALTYCTSLAIRMMKENGINDGHIFNLSSMSGHRLVGILNFYGASKFAVTALTEGFRRELAENTRIKISQISPGLVRTDFLAKTFDLDTAESIFSRVPGSAMKAEDISNTLLFILSAPENVQIHDVLMRPTGEKL